MANTARFGLPLLQAAQAQKHVTMNETISRLDGMTQLTVISTSIGLPPAIPSDGDCYAIPVGGVNEWAGHDRELAVFSNGGWLFTVPATGWTAWVIDMGVRATFDGTSWIANMAAISPNGAAISHKVVEIDHVVSGGATSAVPGGLPGGTIVLGVTGRVLSQFGGTLSGWRLGVAGSDDRYGSGLGLTAGSWVRGLTSSPLAYHANEDLLLTSEGANFLDGEVRLAVHLIELALPSI